MMFTNNMENNIYIIPKYILINNILYYTFYNYIFIIYVYFQLLQNLFILFTTYASNLKVKLNFLTTIYIFWHLSHSLSVSSFCVFDFFFGCCCCLINKLSQSVGFG